MIGADHFNRDHKKGFEFLQGACLLREKLDRQSVACFFRNTAALDKILFGDFLGNHDEFLVQVLHEFAGTFDFQDMNLDSALRHLDTFQLLGESQKIHGVLESQADRYYNKSPQILVNKDVAFTLSSSLIVLDTDHHNAQVKKKMTEEDFIHNNRDINEAHVASDVTDDSEMSSEPRQGKLLRNSLSSAPSNPLVLLGDLLA
ncbi:ARF guanine-nucleotide exchange factor GNOM-like [Olea europaea subsp. europaea]|uniref:ARF guanine-nucleotide exchange factor GNOM-like n=1 Tax=Olea europaea subsp. europaea TaxID=158383 RepID=A0A8S0V9N0_OLEEU|nr:ARF guanine-nucleotide exchange factor GNOM-like [Olea europaea subsp. europaea]